MAKFYFISPINLTSPDLYPSFIETFEKEGHIIVDDIELADVVFFDWHTRIGDYDQDIINKAVERQLPFCMFDEFDYGGMSKKKWFGEMSVLDTEHSNYFNIYISILSRTNVLYFMRKMGEIKTYPKWVYPYEKCYYKDCLFEPTTVDELFSRPYEICFIANESPQRKNVVKGLQDAGFKMDVHWTNEKGKIPHDEWLGRHRQAKLFISADGGGFTDERIQQLFSVSGILRQKNNHLQAHPFVPYANCLEVSEHPTEEEINGIREVLNDKNYLHEIYLDGIEHMKTYYSERARAKYILEIIEKHL